MPGAAGYAALVTQMAFFDAASQPPTVADLAGLLAGTGHAVRSGDRARLSVIVTERWRAEALAEAMTAALGGAEGRVQITDSGQGRLLVRTAADPALTGLADTFARGAVKAVPAGWTPTARALRVWAIAAGRRDAAGYALGLDPHAAHIHPALADAVGRAGLPVTVVGVRAGGPALRIRGRRLLTRLRAEVGEPPAGGAQDWPAG